MAEKAFPADKKARNRFAVALTVVAGAADAIGFIVYAQLFMSFMSGNTTRFGEAVSTFDWIQAVRFGGVIALFCFGCFAGTLIAAWSGRWRLSMLLSIQAVLLCIGATLPHVLPPTPESLPLAAYPVVLALGMQNATLQDEAGRSLALTYVTGSIVRFGAGLANMLLHKPAPSFWIQGPLWAGLTFGAVVGGFLANAFGDSAFMLPAGLAGILAVLAAAATVRNPDSDIIISTTAPQPDAHPSAQPTIRV